MEQRTDLLEVIKYIDPSCLDYQEWLNVGMGLKHEGYTAADWDEWSRQDAGRYHSGECFRKWGSFHGSSSPVTAGTIVQMAMEEGWRPDHTDGGSALEWDDMIGEKRGSGRCGQKLDRRKRNQGTGRKVGSVQDLTRYLENFV